MSFRASCSAGKNPEDVRSTWMSIRRKRTLLRLERALDALAAEMRADHTTNDPAWRERVNEYSRLASEADESATWHANSGERAGPGVRDPSVVHRADS